MSSLSKLRMLLYAEYSYPYSYVCLPTETLPCCLKKFKSWSTATDCYRQT